MSLLPRRLNSRIVLVVSCILLATGASFGWVTADMVNIFNMQAAPPLR